MVRKGIQQTLHTIIGGKAGCWVFVVVVLNYFQNHGGRMKTGFVPMEFLKHFNCFQNIGSNCRDIYVGISPTEQSGIYFGVSKLCNP